MTKQDKTQNTGILFFRVYGTASSPLRGKILESRKQPRILRLATVRTDQGGCIISQQSRLYDPKLDFSPSPSENNFSMSFGWECQIKTSASFAQQYGEPQHFALQHFMDEARRCRLVVAHGVAENIGFLRILSARLNQPFFLPSLICTKQISKGVVGPWKDGLAKAHKIFTGETFTEEWSAPAEVMACKRLYFALRKSKLL